MTYLLAIHKVADFTNWKKGYDESLAARQKAGLKEKYLLRSTEDPNEVVMLHEVEELQRAQAFTRSSELRERMQQSGVVGEPTGYFLTDADAAAPSAH
jgi:heme-degrading monooxygenase HmoA